MSYLIEGLWYRWILPMMKGEMLPKMPKEPPVVHIQARETVPYTPEEQRVRTAAYKIKMTTWKKTMKVINVSGLSTLMRYTRTICTM
jgi:hypothetical protein